MYMIHAPTHKQTRAHTYTHPHTNKRARTHTRTHTQTNARAHIHAPTHKQTRARTHTHAHTHTRTHTHTRRRLLVRVGTRGSSGMDATGIHFFLEKFLFFRFKNCVFRRKPRNGRGRHIFWNKIERTFCFVEKVGHWGWRMWIFLSRHAHVSDLSMCC